MSSTPIIIENDRLLIRGLADQDLAGLTAMRNDPRIYRYEPTFLAELRGTPEEALRTIRSMDLCRDRQCVLGIFQKTDPHVLIGLAELYDFKPAGKVISLGLRLMPEFWGRGIASSCTRALLDFIQNNTPAETVTAHVNPGNSASSRCLLKNGFVYMRTKEEDWGDGRLGVADIYAFDLQAAENRSADPGTRHPMHACVLRPHHGLFPGPGDQEAAD